MRAPGATVAFNVLDATGAVVPFGRVDARARAARVFVRGACFCNPGAAEHAFGFWAAETAVCLERAQVDGAFSLDRFAHCMAPRPVGAVRMSLGLANNDADVHAVAAVADWRDQNFTAKAR